MTTTTGGEDIRASDKSSNGRCNTSGCMEDTSLRIASFSVPTDLMDRIDTREISNIPHNQKSAVVKSGDLRPWVPAAPARFCLPRTLYQEYLAGTV
ncbi:hypothetical protein TNCV_4327341 [Trichonephila clavipes]|nr:hypothetical protein TNCV_4327341 [Trichonephila clavipes]